MQRLSPHEFSWSPMSENDVQKRGRQRALEPNCCLCLSDTAVQEKLAHKAAARGQPCCMLLGAVILQVVGNLLLNFVTSKAQQALAVTV